jgi:HPt (histidine-containing phosphotransfer) domain-containing protein
MSSSKKDFYESILMKSEISLEGLEQIFALDRPEEIRGTFLAELLTVFRQTAPSIIENLTRTIGEKNAKSIENFSHNLKGMAQNLAAIRLSELCALVETESKAGCHFPDGIAEEIKKSYENAAKILDRIVSDGTTPAERS